MPDKITTIMMPPPSAALNAVFFIDGRISKKLCMLAGIQGMSESQVPFAHIEPMIYTENDKCWIRARTVSGYLGVEFVAHPADWSQYKHMERQHYVQERHMEQQAAQIVDAIERDRLRSQMPREEPLPPPPPVPPYRPLDMSLPPEHLPPAGWKPKPVPDHLMPPTDLPPPIKLSDEQKSHRMFQW